MFNYLIAISIIFFLLALWLVVQAVCRHYSEHHPEFGPHREEGQGCGSSCSCSNKCNVAAKNKTQHRPISDKHFF